MGITNPVGTWAQNPDFETQGGTTYKTNIDNGILVARRISRAFSPHEQDTPNMTVRVSAGYIFSASSVLTEIAAQNTGTFTAPISNPRIDRVVIDLADGTVSVIPGSESASPSPPAISTGKLPVAQVRLETTTTEITNANITDERVAVGTGGEFPSATRIVGFAQENPPTGWTRINFAGDLVAKIAASGETGGSDGGTWFLGGLNTTLDGAHSHELAAGALDPNTSTPDNFVYRGDNDLHTAVSGASPRNRALQTTTSGGNHVHLITHDGSWRIRHMVVLMAEKD